MSSASAAQMALPPSRAQRSGYVSRLVALGAPVLAPLGALAGQYLRYSYRTIGIFLERQGHTRSGRNVAVWQRVVHGGRGRRP